MWFVLSQTRSRFSCARTCTTRRVVATAAVACWCASPLHRADEQAGSTCATSWGAPRHLLATDRRPAYVESPSVVPTSRGRLLLGSPALIWHSADAFAPTPPRSSADSEAYAETLRRNFALFGVRFAMGDVASPVSAPTIQSAATHVVGAVTSDGTIHAVWLQTDPGASRDHPRSALMHAAMHGHKWTAPRALYAAQQIYWATGTGALVTHGNSVHVVASYYRPDSGGGVVHVQGIDDSWRVATRSIPALPNYTTASALGHDSLLIVFSAGDVKSGVRNGSHLFALRTGPRDTVLGEPTRIQWSGLGAASWPQLVDKGAYGVTPGRVSLTWGVLGAESGASDSLFLMVTRDGGRTWSGEAGLRLPSRASHIASVSDAHGIVHVVVLAQAGNEPASGRALWYTRHGLKDWQSLVRLDVGEIGSSPTLSRLGVDTLMMSWGRPIPVLGGLAFGQSAPAGMYALLVGRCFGSRQ